MQGWPASVISNHLTVTNGLPNSTGQSFRLFSFQLSFFLWTTLGLFVLFPFAFVFFSPISHIYSSFLFLHPTYNRQCFPRLFTGRASCLSSYNIIP